MAEIIEEEELRNKKYVFKDRFHAGKLLALKLKQYKDYFTDAIVLAIPYGGVPVGKSIARELGYPLELIMVRKIPIPYNPEAGFGAVTWDGEVVINQSLLDQLGLGNHEIEQAIQRVKLELERRMQAFGKTLPELNDRSVIITDDGLASGYTMLASLRSIKKHSPKSIAIAVPTASTSAIKLVSTHVDMLFCLNIRESMVFAVADAYQEWHDLTDKEVREIIHDK